MNATTDTPFHSRSIRVAGVRSPVFEAGISESDEAVVFVHGNPGSAKDWHALMLQVSDFARTLAPDMPGFGQADKPAHFEYTIEGYARHLQGLLEALGVRRTHLVLHDFGGPWGLEWATQHPEQVASLTLINIGVLLDYRWHYLARIWRTPILGELFGFPPTRWIGDRFLKHGNPRGLPRDLVDRMYASLQDRGTRRAILKLYRATDNPGRVGEAHAAGLRPLRLPALVVWGRQDPYLPVRLAERQREVFPDARIVLLDESGHWPFADDPEGVAEAVVPFLQQQILHEVPPPGTARSAGRDA